MAWSSPSRRSRRGNVVQSAIGDEQRSEAGGLQNTAQQLGSSLGTALLGAIVITGLIAAFTTNIAGDPQVNSRVEQQVEVQLSSGASFVASAQVREAAEEAAAVLAVIDRGAERRQRQGGAEGVPQVRPP